MTVTREEMIKVKERVVISRETEIKNAEEMKEEAADNVTLRWEKFLPKMDMIVLLVEADDSTRHIITALLQKCGYKVAAFSDGSKAWEVLNGRSHNIDLILTEVELPSISGFSLLSLVTEHEVCRNIPVIMMSAHDSVSTVYNCMLKGAADFLVKPIRKNELNNLWQHVWRRQVSSSGQAQAASDVQQMVEITPDRYRECNEKGTDAQSSCSLPDLEAKKECSEHKHTITQPKQRRSPSIGIMTQNVEHEKGSERTLKHDGEARGSTSASKTNSDVLMLRGDMAADSHCEHANIIIEAFDYDNDYVHNNSFREAIDLIGTFNTYPECSYKSLESTYGLNKLDSSLTLELSLKQSHPRGSLNQVMDDDRNKLKQSDTSAFSRYNSRTFQPLYTTSESICDQERGYETNLDIQPTHQVHEYSSGNYCPIVSHDNNTISPIVGHDNNTISPISDRLGIQFPCSQQVIPVTVPVKGASFERLCNVYDNLIPPLFCTRSSQSPMQSPVSSGNHEPSIQVNENCSVNQGIRNSKKLLQYLMDQNIHNASALMEHKKSYDLEPLKDQAHFPPASNQHGSGDFCNGISNRFNNINSGGNHTTNAYELVKVAAKNENEATFIHDEKLNRSQREAALTKFRMKRKERCFDKKVRYQSRSKLAVQRPRVKGQFVRQVQTEAIALETYEQDS